MPIDSTDDLSLKFVLEADKQASIKSVDDTLMAIQQLINKLKPSNIGNLLLPSIQDGKVLKNQYTALFKQGEKYYKAAIKFDEKTKSFGILGGGAKAQPISQEEAWRLGGVDPSRVFADIESARLTENLKQAEKLSKDVEKNVKKTTGPLNRLIKTIVRVGFYRVAKGLLVQVGDLFTAGIQGLIEFDKGVNRTASQLLSEYEKLRGSISLIIAPFLESFLPAMQSITSTVIEFANNVSMANAAAKGMTTYTKINDEYFKDMAAQANNLNASFDKFETLNGQGTVFERATISEDDTEKISETQSIIENVKSTLTGLANSLATIFNLALKIYERVIKPILPALTDIVSEIVNIVAKTIEWLDKWGLLENAVKLFIAAWVGVKALKLIDWFTSVGKSITNLIGLISKLGAGMSSVLMIMGAIVGFLAASSLFSSLLEDASEAEKTFSIILGSLIALASVITAIRYLIQGNWLGAIAGATAMGVGLGVMVAGIKAKQYADGGMVDRGSLFIAGESGAELVTQMPSGQTGVTNIAQFKQAMVEALYEAQDIFQQPQQDVNLYLDGAEVARSKRFKSELNRTNSGLNLR